MFFPNYTFENPSTYELRFVREGSYMLAALLASLYVWWRTDFSTFLRTVLPNLLILTVATVAVMLAAILPLSSPSRLVAIAVAWIILALLQSRMMVRAVVRYHVRNGWEVARA